MAFTVYGGLTLSGLVFKGTVMSAILVWILAAAIWAGFWLNRRDQARTVRQGRLHAQQR